MTITTHSPGEGEARQRTYVTCLHCGEELAYNWQEMKIEGRSRILSAPSGPAPVIPFRNKKLSVYRRLLHADSATLTRAQAGR